MRFACPSTDSNENKFALGLPATRMSFPSNLLCLGGGTFVLNAGRPTVFDVLHDGPCARFISKLGGASRPTFRLFCDGDAGVTGMGASGRSLFDPAGTVVSCAVNNGTHINNKPNIAIEEELAHDRNDACIGFSPRRTRPLPESVAGQQPIFRVAATTKVVHATNQTELLEVGVTFTVDCS